MGSVCTEQQYHKFHHSHQLNLKQKLIREIDIPPRKLHSRRRHHHHHHLDTDCFIDSDDDSLLYKYFLPSNDVDDEDEDEDEDDPYSSDHFRIYEFKVRKCSRSRSHDWTDCPFAHPGEKARRRDPRRYSYSGTMCPEFRRGSCDRGDKCEFSHGVFECRLHPYRYRTEACKDGKNCMRKICFFAHTPRQLRVLPSNCHESQTPSSLMNSPVFHEMKNKNIINQSCCVHCFHSVAANSPTSTLLGMSYSGHSHTMSSPPLSPSPPPSPANPVRISPISRYKDKFANRDPSGFHNQINSGVISNYKVAVNEMMNSMESMQLNQEPISPVLATPTNSPWVDVNFNSKNQYHDQFIISPSKLIPGGGTSLFSSKNLVEDNENNGLVGPDLGWVNDLLT